MAAPTVDDIRTEYKRNKAATLRRMESAAEDVSQLKANNANWKEGSALYDFLVVCINAGVSFDDIPPAMWRIAEMKTYMMSLNQIDVGAADNRCVARMVKARIIQKVREKRAEHIYFGTLVETEAQKAAYNEHEACLRDALECSTSGQMPYYCYFAAYPDMDMTAWSWLKLAGSVCWSPTAAPLVLREWKRRADLCGQREEARQRSAEALSRAE